MAGASDDQLALLTALTGYDLEQCRQVLTQCGGDANQAAQLLLDDTSSFGRGLSDATGEIGIPPCSGCGELNADGHWGETDYYCDACWNSWETAAWSGEYRGAKRESSVIVGSREEEAMLDRDLGIIEGTCWEDVGYQLAAVTAESRRVPLERSARSLNRDRWGEVAAAARAGVASRQHGVMKEAAAFLFGAERACGPDIWRLLTIYEMQVNGLLPRRLQAHECSDESCDGPPPVPSGCTGIACAVSGLLGQTEEVDVRIYDYGNLDRVARLRCSGSQQAALIYDPACTFCPIGLGVGGLGLTRFTLYPRCVPVVENLGGVPLSAVLWELLLRDHTLGEAVLLLRRLFDTGNGDVPLADVPMAAGAAMLLSQPGHGIVLVEWSRNHLWISPIACEGILVHANHCVVGSGLLDNEDTNIAKLNSDSRHRQAALEEFYADELVAGRGPQMSDDRLKVALSVAGVHNDSVLATVVVAPADRSLHVRFRLQTEGMELAHDTLSCDFWQLFVDDEDRQVKRRWGVSSRGVK